MMIKRWHWYFWRFYKTKGISIYYTCKNIKKSYKNNKFKISAPTWNEEFQLPKGSYSVSDVQEYFEYIIKKHETFTDNPSIRIYLNKTKKRITFEIKTGYNLKLLTTETKKLLGSTSSKITKVKNGENLPHLEITEVVLVHCNTANNDCQQDSRVLYILVPNKSSGQVLDTSPKNFIFLKTFDSEFSYIEVRFTNQNSKLLETEDKINITLFINWSVKYKKWSAIQINIEIKYL